MGVKWTPGAKNVTLRSGKENDQRVDSESCAEGKVGQREESGN